MLIVVIADIPEFILEWTNIWTGLQVLLNRLTLEELHLADPADPNLVDPADPNLADPADPELMLKKFLIKTQQVT